MGAGQPPGLLREQSLPALLPGRGRAEGGEGPQGVQGSRQV